MKRCRPGEEWTHRCILSHDHGGAAPARDHGGGHHGPQEATGHDATCPQNRPSATVLFFFLPPHLLSFSHPVDRYDGSWSQSTTVGQPWCSHAVHLDPAGARRGGDVVSVYLATQRASCTPRTHDAVVISRLTSLLMVLPGPLDAPGTPSRTPCWRGGPTTTG